MNEGRIVSSDGIDVAPGAWTRCLRGAPGAVVERAAGARPRRRPYLLGPTARITLAGDQLHPVAREALAATGLADAIRSSVFRSIVARAVELVDATAEALDIVDGYAPPARAARRLDRRAPASPPGRPRRRAGCSSTLRARRARARAPRPDRAADEPEPGRHRGTTSTTFAPSVLDLPHAEATQRLEQLIRSYDPCISCATHFLDLHVERR